jgi:hypothetical protein
MGLLRKDAPLFFLAAMQAGFLAIRLGSPSPRPNPQKLLVLARDLLVVPAT